MSLFEGQIKWPKREFVFSIIRIVEKTTYNICGPLKES